MYFDYFKLFYCQGKKTLLWFFPLTWQKNLTGFEYTDQKLNTGGHNYVF